MFGQGRYPDVPGDLPRRYPPSPHPVVARSVKQGIQCNLVANLVCKVWQNQLLILRDLCYPFYNDLVVLSMSRHDDVFYSPDRRQISPELRNSPPNPAHPRI